MRNHLHEDEKKTSEKLVCNLKEADYEAACWERFPLWTFSWIQERYRLLRQ